MFLLFFVFEFHSLFYCLSLSAREIFYLGIIYIFYNIFFVSKALRHSLFRIIDIFSCLHIHSRRHVLSNAHSKYYTDNRTDRTNIIFREFSR